MTEHNQKDHFEENPQVENISATSGASTATMNWDDENAVYGSSQGGEGDSLRRQAGEATSKVRQVVRETVTDTAGMVTDQAKQRLGQATETTKQELTNVTEQVRRQADSLVSEQKGMAADRLHTLADTLRQSSRQLQEQQEGTVGRYAEIVADQIDMASDFLRTRNTGDLLGEVQRLARRSPEAFVAGSLAVGFLLGRFIKGPSRSAMRTGSEYQGYQGQGYQGQGYTGSVYGQGQYQGQGYQGQGYTGSAGQGMYRGSDNPAEGVMGSGEMADNQSSAYAGRFETTGIQGNAFQQGGYESSGYQAEGADDIQIESNYEGGNNAYQTGPDITEGSDTDYPRYDPSYAGGGSIPEANTESTDDDSLESDNFTTTSRR
jgi:hypothetical protein